MGAGKRREKKGEKNEWSREEKERGWGFATRGEARLLPAGGGAL